MEECIPLLYCFDIAGKTSIQLPSHFSKTGLLRRSLIVRLNLSAKRAPNELFLEYCLKILLFKNFEKYCFIILFLDQFRLKLVFFLSLEENFQNSLFLFEHFYF